MHFFNFNPAHLALLLLGLFGMSIQAHADQTCFAADGVYLKEAVTAVVNGNWNDPDEYGSIENWCTKQVTTMSKLFYLKGTFNEDISKWDTSSVTDMYGMFWQASICLQPIHWRLGYILCY